MTRDELVRDTRQLIAEGERLTANPSQAALRVWLQLTDDEEAAYVRDVASAKTAVLKMSVEALTRHGMPFVGETRPLA